jgi:hypothetical protein
MNHPRFFHAIHEAGHAVTCAALGGRVTSVDIYRIEDRGGLCRYIAPDDPVADLAICLAGAIAEAEARMRRGKLYNGSASQDLREVATTLRPKLGRGVGMADLPEFKQAEALAKRIIGQSWGAVDRLARWLLEHETASGELAAAIYQEHESKRELKTA